MMLEKAFNKMKEMMMRTLGFGNTGEDEGKQQDNNKMKKDTDMHAIMLAASLDEGTITEESEYQGGETEDSKGHLLMSMKMMWKMTPKIKMVKMMHYSYPKNGPTLWYMMMLDIGFQSNKTLTASLEMMHSTQ